MSIEDVTPRVTGALKPGMTSDQASNARNAASLPLKGNLIARHAGFNAPVTRGLRPRWTSARSALNP